jgi:hypothetical protein
MTQEQKDLLLKDLCARLPYGVICKDDYAKVEGKLVQIGINYDMCLLSDDYGKTEFAYIPNCKPHLFPLSSMTEEQKEEYCKLQERVIYNSKGLVNTDIVNYTNWCYKNHFDINGLIPMGLANDATGLDIYRNYGNKN